MPNPCMHMEHHRYEEKPIDMKSNGIVPMPLPSVHTLIVQKPSGKTYLLYHQQLFYMLRKRKGGKISFKATKGISVEFINKKNKAEVMSKNKIVRRFA